MLLFSLVLFLATPVQTAAVHERLGKEYEAKGQLEKAASEYERASRLSPYEEAYYFEAAHAYLLREQFEPAIKILERGCKVFDKSAQLQLALGVAYYGQRRFSDAVDAFLRTIDLAPEVEQPYLFLSRMLDQAAGRMPEILRRFQSWAAANPRNAKAQFVYARGLIDSGGDAAKAEKLLRTSIELKPGQWESHYQLGVLLENKKRFTEAAAELERSISLNPNKAETHYHLARVYDRLGQSDKAVEQRAIHQQLTSAKSTP